MLMPLVFDQDCVMPDDFETMMELLDDVEFNALAQEREAGHFFDIDLNEL